MGKRNLSTGDSHRRCRTWQGVSVPEYPFDAGYHPRQPRVTQIQNALAGTGPTVWKVWVQRLQMLNPARWAALQNAFQHGRALRGVRYNSDRPCHQCRGCTRTAVLNRCTTCYSSVRFNAPRKHTEQELTRAAATRQQRESQSLIPCVVAGIATGWIVVSDSDAVRFWHPTKTERVLRLLEPILHNHFMQHDPQYRSLFLWAIENQPLPEWASVMHTTNQNSNH